MTPAFFDSCNWIFPFFLFCKPAVAAVSDPSSTNWWNVASTTASVVSAMAAAVAAIFAYFTIHSTKSERRVSALVTIKEWYSRSHEKFGDVTKELDYGTIAYDPFARESKKEAQLLSFLSTLNEVAFLVEIGHATEEDIRKTSLGYWFTAALSDNATVAALAKLMVADKARGYESSVFPFLTEIGPKITAKQEHKLVRARAEAMSNDQGFKDKVLDVIRPASGGAATP
ncbi:hypothetical protein [Rhizobium wenxiniae]|uniref:hypothetical protein n=1 Tax=Rhizobium wenxiniae TaxID=1737357 RepID=UPI003C1B65E5